MSKKDTMSSKETMSSQSDFFIGLAKLARLDKPIGIFLVLWPTLWALWMAAEGIPKTDVLIIFIAGVILMRSAGCVINDFADRKIDGHVERTKERPLVSGLVTPIQALIFFGILCLIAFLLVLQTNSLTIYLSFGALGLASLYPFMKRYTYLPQVVLGAAFAWAVPMAYAAQSNDLPNIIWLIYTATVVWTVAYDTMYAMVDRDDDVKIGVKSTAILFGKADRAIIAFLQLFVVLTLALIGDQLDLGQFYFLGIVVTSVLFVYQQHLIRHRDRQDCFKAFLNNNWVGLAMFVAIFLDYQV